MKLYTEEQVIDFKREIANILELLSIRHGYSIDEAVEDISNLLTPIELPSDEEITEFILKNYYNRDTSHQAGFLKGAKWMKTQILNQNK